MTELKGLPTNTGKAKGTGHLLDVKQGIAFGSHVNMQGKVLVARMTNPGMMRHIRAASAVACEGGGRTCHAAVVCREIGKPCAVGVVGLLSAFSSHPKPAHMEVDGTQGTVKFTDFKFVED